MPKDRGAEQREVDGSRECSLAMGMVADEARQHVAGQQAAKHIPWVGAHSKEDAHTLRVAEDPRHSLPAGMQRCGFLVSGCW